MGKMGALHFIWQSCPHPVALFMAPLNSLSGPAGVLPHSPHLLFELFSIWSPPRLSLTCVINSFTQLHAFFFPVYSVLLSDSHILVEAVVVGLDGKPPESRSLTHACPKLIPALALPPLSKGFSSFQFKQLSVEPGLRLISSSLYSP